MDAEDDVDEVGPLFLVVQEPEEEREKRQEQEEKSWKIDSEIIIPEILFSIHSHLRSEPSDHAEEEDADKNVKKNRRDVANSSTDDIFPGEVARTGNKWSDRFEDLAIEGEIIAKELLQESAHTRGAIGCFLSAGRAVFHVRFEILATISAVHAEHLRRENSNFSDHLSDL